MSLSLPAVLEKNGNQRTANTASDYWSLQYQGFKVVEGADPETVGLSPQQKAARTRAENRAKKAAETSNDGDGQTDTAGDAAGGGDLTDAGDPDQTA